jgi:N-acyl-D-amino-acid deacylase
MAMKVSQGVTTVVVGNCGVSLAPWIVDGPPPPSLDLTSGKGSARFATFGAYLDAIDRQGAALNAACLVGHSTLRAGAMDSFDRPATGTEIAAMRALLGEALDAGAIGLSTGLYYKTANAAPRSEVESLAELLAPAGALHSTHMRDEGDHVTDAMDEAFAIGRHAGVPVMISHFKVTGLQNFGRSRETLAKFATAMAQQPLGLDVYPYPASSTELDPDFIEGDTPIMVTWSQSEPKAAGRYLDDIAREWGVDRLAAARRLMPAGAVYFEMDEDDVRRILSFRETMIGSDGIPDDSHPHPRLWGTFPRVLGHYVRDVGLLTLPEAIRRMTGLPAERYRLKDRGRLLPGCWADLVLFDPATVIDRATFENPKLPAAGIDAVFVAGQPVWQNGKSTGARPGRALRRDARANGTGSR